MEDTSSASSDSDNALLSPNSISIGCNAATQTPEMPRHDKFQSEPPPQPKPIHRDSNPSIIVYKLDAQKPFSELEHEARTLAIPDVVVEYIKDSCNFQDTGNTGTANPAFEQNELIIVRTPSAVSLRDEILNESNNLAPIGTENRRLYYSLPRSHQKPADKVDSHGCSQPPSPKFGRLLNVGNPSLSASMSSLGYPRSIPPSPNFGYRPLESETSAVYTIISPVKYAVNGNDKENELRLMKQLAQMKKDNLIRKFDYNPAPEEVETKRERLQCITDTCSLMFLIPGIFIAVVTPVILIPMFLMPLKYYIPLIAVFIISGCVAVVSLAFSGLTGNVVWHYNADKKKLQPRFHCGRGPLFHFWGNGFYRTKRDKEPLQDAQIV